MVLTFRLPYVQTKKSLVSAHKQMLVDNQYTADYGNGQYSYTQQSAPNGYGAHEQAGYPPAPTNGNKEEEGMYRYASSRLTGQASHTTSKPSSVHNGHGQNPMAELNSLSHQQPPQGSSPHLRTPVTYQSHPVRNSSTSQPDYSKSCSSTPIDWSTVFISSSRYHRCVHAFERRHESQRILQSVRA